ncbi:MAG: PKD domain-containing protein [Candidatus Hydrogenedentes bacterium]|jgi:PhoPQ-activated pathogenicity-related protein/PKD repeat protein|nr:PKD domain-containing protein [Candidatus Hydrogenedentota bacterium]
MKRIIGVRGALCLLSLSFIFLSACAPRVGVTILVSQETVDFGAFSMEERLLVAKNYSSTQTDPIIISADQPWILLDECTEAAAACYSTGPNDRLRIAIHINRDILDIGLNRGALYIRSGQSSMVTVPVTAEGIAKADFTQSHSEIVIGKPIQFQENCLTTAAAGDVLSWQWDFGDGSISTQPNPSHLYAASGIYSVTLSIETTKGIKRTVTKTNCVNVVNPTALVDFVASKTSVGTGEAVLFENRSTLDPALILRQEWDFGDGSSSGVFNPTHHFTQSGSYTISLKLYTASQVYEAVKPNYITVSGSLSVDFRYDNAFVKNNTQFFPIIFGANGNLNYLWDFGDGTTSTEELPTHSYSEKGAYTVVLKVTDSRGGGTQTKNLQINYKPPQVLFSATPRRQLVGKEVEFRDTSIAGFGTVSVWHWNFGDGTTSDLRNPKHVYERTGMYTVSLEVTSVPDGQKGSLVRKNYIAIVDQLDEEGEGEGELLELDRYVNAVDNCFTYSTPKRSTLREGGFPIAIAYEVEKMVSQCWNPDDSVYSNDQVDYRKWTHGVTIVDPIYKQSNTAMLFIDGGSRNSTIQVDDLAKMVALLSGTTVVHLKNVPSQPIIFKEEVVNPGDEDNYSNAPIILRSRTEDAIIAYSYDKYLESYKNNDGEPTESWPLLFPMVKSAVKAMDMAEEILAANGVAVDGFVVAGASKRGWTTWLTGATDSRIKGIAPIVINVLNMKPHLEHHRASYGYWSPAIYDYAQKGIFDQLISTSPNEALSTEAIALLGCVDPYEYALRGRYVDMPKLMLNATGDQFFVPDTTQYYFDELPASKHLSYVPNVGHGMGFDSKDTLNIETLNNPENPIGRLLGWYMAVTQKKALPQFEQTFKEDGSIRVTVDPANPPIAVQLWEVTSKDKRDFRDGILQDKWIGKNLEEKAPGVYEARPNDPATGSYKGFYIQVEYENSATLPMPITQFYPELNTPNFVFTTGVRVLPVDNKGNPTYPEFIGYLANELRHDAVPFDANEMPVITLYGTPQEMGRDYGELLSLEIAHFIPGFVDAQDLTPEELQGLWDEYVLAGLDERIVEEIEGIAQTSGVDLSLLQMAHAAAMYEPDFWTASSTMVYGNLAGGKDSAKHGITINSDLNRTFNNDLCAVVYIPNKGVPHTVLTYAGLAFGYTGINLGGITVGEIPLSSIDKEDKSSAMPVMRTALYDAFSLREAIALTEEMPPLNTYLVFGDGRNEIRAAKVLTDDEGVLPPVRYDLAKEDFNLSTPGVVYDSSIDNSVLKNVLTPTLENFTLEALLGIVNMPPFAKPGQNVLNVAYENYPLNIFLFKGTQQQDANAMGEPLVFNMQALLP